MFCVPRIKYSRASCPSRASANPAPGQGTGSPGNGARPARSARHHPRPDPLQLVLPASIGTGRVTWMWCCGRITAPGEKVFVEPAGDTVEIIHPITGETRSRKAKILMRHDHSISVSHRAALYSGSHIGDGALADQ